MIEHYPRLKRAEQESMWSHACLLCNNQLSPLALGARKSLVSSAKPVAWSRTRPSTLSWAFFTKLLDLLPAVSFVSTSWAQALWNSLWPFSLLETSCFLCLHSSWSNLQVPCPIFPIWGIFSQEALHVSRPLCIRNRSRQHLAKTLQSVATCQSSGPSYYHCLWFYKIV